MIILCYKGSKFNNNDNLLKELQINDDKFDNNNEDKVYLLLKRGGW